MESAPMREAHTSSQAVLDRVREDDSIEKFDVEG